MSFLCYSASSLLYERIPNGDKIKKKAKRLKSFVYYRRIRSRFIGDRIGRYRKDGYFILKKVKKGLSAALAFLLIAGMGSCSGGGGSRNSDTQAAAPAVTTTLRNELDEEINYNDMANIEEINASDEEGTGPLYVSGQKAGTVKGLCYYDFSAETPELSQLLAERYGGVLETEICSSGSAYFERLNMRIASGDSPDLVRYDWEAYPWGTFKNMYTALDEWLDIDSPLWEGEKEVIEQFSFLGRHYYFPQDIMPNFSIIYNRVSLDEVGLPDPMDLYDSGEWDWNAFEDMIRKWVEQGDDYIGLTGGQWTALMFANTTGTKVMDIQGNEFVNNMKDLNVQRAMDWVSELKRQNLFGDGFVDPSEAFIDGKLLFLSMGWEWGFTEAQNGLFKKNLEYDFAFVPFPKDPQADKYYHAADSFGYMVPAGAKNVQGGVDYILCSRIYATDPEIIAADRAEKMSTDPVYYPKCPSCKYNFKEHGQEDLTVCPECDTPRRQKFKEYYSERQLDVLDDMKNPDKFEFIYDASFGLGEDFSKIFINSQEESLYDGPIWYGSSYTQLRDTYYNVIESYLTPYREALAGG